MLSTYGNVVGSVFSVPTAALLPRTAALFSLFVSHAAAKVRAETKVEELRPADEEGEGDEKGVNGFVNSLCLNAEEMKVPRLPGGPSMLFRAFILLSVKQRS